MANSETNSRPRLAWWLFVLALASNLYLLGAACVLLAVAYPLLGDVTLEQLPKIHAAMTGRLGVAFILPEMVAFVSVLPLFRWPLRGLSKTNVALCVFFGVLYFAVTFSSHLPAHKLLSLGDISAMPALLSSHALRTVVQLVKCGILVAMYPTRD